MRKVDKLKFLSPRYLLTLHCQNRNNSLLIIRVILERVLECLRQIQAYSAYISSE